MKPAPDAIFSVFVHTESCVIEHYVHRNLTFTRLDAYTPMPPKLSQCRLATHLTSLDFYFLIDCYALL